MKRWVSSFTAQVEVEAENLYEANRMVSEWAQAVEDGYGQGVEDMTARMERVRMIFSRSQFMYGVEDDEESGGLLVSEG